MCYNSWIWLKELKAYFQVILPAKMTMPDSQRYPWKLHLINNVKDLFVSLGLYVINFYNSFMFSCRNAQANFVEKPLIEITGFLNIGNWNLIHTIDQNKLVRGPFWIRYCHLCTEGPLLNMLTVPREFRKNDKNNLWFQFATL